MSSTDTKTIFELLSLRYSCLELTGNGLLAAQESKALEDLNSTFYYVDRPAHTADVSLDGEQQPEPDHIMPFDLRLQALRLQAIGFSDARRGVSALYDLGLECREHIASSFTSSQDREIWVDHLEETGIRVVNALIEMGDLDCAIRTLASLKPSKPNNVSTWKWRMILLHLKIGDLTAAGRLMQETAETDTQSSISVPLLTFAEGRYEDAALAWESCLEMDTVGEEAALVKQNLAVAYLYSGHIEKSQKIMEGLVNEGNSFSSLVNNLATLYELTSDRSREMKSVLASKVAGQEVVPNRNWSKTSADFKL